MRIAINFILVFCLAVGPVGLANPPHGGSPTPTENPQHVKVEVTIPAVPAPGSATSEDLKQLMTEAHESLEGEESGNFLTRWVHQFNYRRLFLNAYRWYEVKRADPKTRDHALNLVMMLGISHTIETAGGLALASLGLQPDTHPFLRLVYGILGVGITIPGLDPLCIGLLALYWRAPVTMDSALQVPRVAIVKSTSFLARTLGISAVMRWMWENKSSREWLEQKLKDARPGTYVYETTVDKFDFQLTTATGSLKLTLRGDETGRFGVARVEHQGKFSKRELTDWLTLFGWNVKDAVIEIATLAQKNGVEELGKKIYTKSASQTDGFTVVETKPEALGISSGSSLRPWNAAKRAVLRCSQWMGGA